MSGGLESAATVSELVDGGGQEDKAATADDSRTFCGPSGPEMPSSHCSPLQNTVSSQNIKDRASEVSSSTR